MVVLVQLYNTIASLQWSPSLSPSLQPFLFDWPFTLMSSIWSLLDRCLGSWPWTVMDDCLGTLMVFTCIWVSDPCLTVDSDGRLPGELPWWIVNQGSCGHLTVLSPASWGWLWGEFKSLPSTSYNKVWICHQGNLQGNLLDMLHPNRQVSGYEVRRPCPMADATVLTIPLKLHLTKTRWSKTIAYGICATVDKKCLLETHPPTSCPHQV